ncbi:hypothetical protein [Bacillus salipaludis]|uniref:Uncharacterized protein n=1 Tax=Bacillus salipaludis TaxID=2547811 RepID=A0AA90TWT0_9BACI|nr:hypothetical protein [Bacillus salipaludis]MDQ6600994.1 hypothetical protein [Bacillus salipaludis]
MTPLIRKEKIISSDKFFQRINQVEVEYVNYWKEHTLWNWEFWVSVALSIIPWLVWIILRKRGSEARLLLAGIFGLSVASWLDFLGLVFGLWHYSGRLLPTCH